MASVFKFKDYSLEINIAGEPFIIDCRDKGDLLARLGDAGKILSDEIASGEKTVKDAMWDTSALMTAATGGEPISIRARGESIEIRKNYTPTYAVGAIRVGVN